MLTYRYKAVDPDGIIKKGAIEANNELDLEQRLLAIGFELISFSEKKESFFSKKKTGRVSRRDLIAFVIHLEQLTKAGVPIITGLKDLRDTMEHSPMQGVLSSLVSSIESGQTLSEALEEYPDIFDHVFITLIKVGESSGKLDTILFDLAESLKWVDELISHTKKIMIYPAIVLVVVMGVVTFLMIYLVPQLIPFIIEMGGEIPLHTKLLIIVSQAFVEYWYLIFSTPFIIIFSIRYFYKNSLKFHYKVDQFLLNLWLIGPLLLKIKLARFANYLSLMYAAGISILDAIEISEALLDNMVLEEALNKTRMQLYDGKSITESFRNVGIFPALVIRMINVGEMSGALDESLNNISYFYNREVRESIEKLEPALQPMLTVVMGAIIAWIMISVLGPVYDTISKINY